MHNTRNFEFDECMLSKSAMRFISVDPVTFIHKTLDIILLYGYTQI